MRNLFLGLIWIYRWTISPVIGYHCRFTPSCSNYAEQVIRKYGAFKGSWLTIKRLCRCHPWHPGGSDPAP